MSLNKPFSTVLQDYNEEAILASGDELYVNVTTPANIRDVCEKTDTMSLRDPIPASETEDVHMTSVSPSHNRQITPPRTFQDTSSDTLPLDVSSHNKQINPTIPPPPPKDSLHNNKRTPRASSTDSSSSASSHSSKHRRSRSMHVPRDSHKRKHSSHRHSKHHKHSRHSTPRHSPSPPPRRHSPPPTVPGRSNTSRHNSISRHTSNTANKHSHHASSGRDTPRQRTPEIRDNNTRTPRVQRCFNCGRPGHMKKDCRQPRRRLKTAQNQRAQCFVFKAPITNLHIHK
ncbi:cyclin-T2-like [Montipora foliosa]|uniref:cyclin-T2-like n=1 Tax=Montipora foliosa TaxID=591990 RepID=UPI0035F21B29